MKQINKMSDTAFNKYRLIENTVLTVLLACMMLFNMYIVGSIPKQPVCDKPIIIELPSPIKQADNNSTIIYDIVGKLAVIEYRLDKLNNKGMSVSKQIDSTATSLETVPTAIVQPVVNPTNDSYITDSLKLQLDDRDKTIKELSYSNIKQKRNKYIWQGLSLGEAVYIGFKTIQSIK